MINYSILGMKLRFYQSPFVLVIHISQVFTPPFKPKGFISLDDYIKCIPKNISADDELLFKQGEKVRYFHKYAFYFPSYKKMSSYWSSAQGHFALGRIASLR